MNRRAFFTLAVALAPTAGATAKSDDSVPIVEAAPLPQRLTNVRKKIYRRREDGKWLEIPFRDIKPGETVLALGINHETGELWENELWAIGSKGPWVNADGIETCEVLGTVNLLTGKFDFDPIGNDTLGDQ